MKRQFFPLLIILIGVISSCSIFGVHFKIHNPKRAGKYPKETEAVKLFGNQASKYRTCYDVKWYSLTVDFQQNTPKQKFISGVVYISATSLADFDTIQLDLAKDMKLEWVKMLNHPEQGQGALDNPSLIKTSRIENCVYLIMKTKFAQGQNFTLEIGFSGEPVEAKRPPWDGGFSRKQDDLKNPWWGVSCETEGASLWFPCKDVVNDEPDSVDMYYTVPDTLVAVGNGNLVETKSLQGCCKLKEYHWHVSYPINLYDVTFYIGKFRLLHDIYISPVTHDTLHLNHYVLEQHYDKAVKEFPQVKDYIAFYEETYGPFPWYRDGFKLVESPYEGMEHQTAIAYGAGFRNDNRWGFDYIILHETAHEWWGNSVTAEDLGDGWIHEGFATYTEALWVEHKFGHDSYLQYLLQYRWTIINRRPVSRPYNIRYFDYHDEDIYTKGAWILHTLRYAIGDDKIFFDVLKTFYARYTYKNATTQDLEKVAEELSGQDLKWFFDQYLYNRFVPELEYCVKDGKLYYRWGKTGKDFRMNINCSVSDDAGYQTISPSANEIRTILYSNPGNVIFFNDDLALFKPVENKSLPKLFAKQNQK